MSPHTYCRKSEDRALSESKADACAKLDLSLDKGWMNHRAGAWMLHMPFPCFCRACCEACVHTCKGTEGSSCTLQVGPRRGRLQVDYDILGSVQR